MEDRSRRVFHPSENANVEAATTVLVVGGGALGIQFTSDIAAVYPQKRVTLLHSRPRLLPRFDNAVHEEALRINLSLLVKHLHDGASVFKLRWPSHIALVLMAIVKGTAGSTATTSANLPFVVGTLQ